MARLTCPDRRLITVAIPAPGTHEERKPSATVALVAKQLDERGKFTRHEREDDVAHTNAEVDA